MRLHNCLAIDELAYSSKNKGKRVKGDKLKGGMYKGDGKEQWRGSKSLITPGPSKSKLKETSWLEKSHHLAYAMQIRGFARKG